MSDTPTMKLSFSAGVTLVNHMYDPADPDSPPGYLAYSLEIDYNPLDPHDLIDKLRDLTDSIATEEHAEEGS